MSNKKTPIHEKYCQLWKGGSCTCIKESPLLTEKFKSGLNNYGVFKTLYHEDLPKNAYFYLYLRNSPTFWANTSIPHRNWKFIGTWLSPLEFFEILNLQEEWSTYNLDVLRGADTPVNWLMLCLSESAAHLFQAHLWMRPAWLLFQHILKNPAKAFHRDCIDQQEHQKLTGSKRT